MAKETAGDEKHNAGHSTEAGVHKPEWCRRHFFEETADPANKIITGEERQIINTNDGGRQSRGSYARVERDRNWKNVGESDAVEQMKGNEPGK